VLWGRKVQTAFDDRIRSYCTTGLIKEKVHISNTDIVNAHRPKIMLYCNISVNFILNFYILTFLCTLTIPISQIWNVFFINPTIKVTSLSPKTIGTVLPQIILWCDVCDDGNTRPKHVFINLLAPKDNYSGRTAPLTSNRCILYIYSTNAGTEYFKLGIYSPFFLFKMQFVS